jgi:hypothetical protein
VVSARKKAWEIEAAWMVLVEVTVAKGRRMGLKSQKHGGGHEVTVAKGLMVGLRSQKHGRG